MKKKLFSLILLVIISIPTHGQKAPVKFGEVSLEELQMKSCYLDTTASAVVLCDYGFFRASNLNFTRIVRIKILKKEGYSWANKTFKSDFKSTLRGVTTNLENGEIIQEKLRNDAIYSTRIVNDYYILRPAMPNVKVGSVIDLEFSFHGIPMEWRFQEEIPVIHSELIMEEPRGITFRTNFFGYERLTYSTPTRWIARDMHAFKMEPFMSSIENFITKIKFDLVTFSSTWNKVDELLIENSYFGMPSTSTSFLNDISDKLSKKYKKREDLLKAAYDTLRETIVWNDITQLTSSEGNPANVYKMKAGNSADVNLILYKLLKKLDFEVSPVALSTRENGMLSIYNPSLRQLNYVIVLARIGEKQYLLDATEKYMPFNMLPLRCLNSQGRLIDKTKGAWVDVSNSKKNKDLSVFDLSLETDLSLKGTISFIRNDYSAFDFRKKYNKLNSKDDYIEAYLKEMPGLRINDLTFDYLDSVYRPVSEKQTVEIRNQVNQIDNNLYIVPAYFGEQKDNPFKSDIRKFPIDFGIPVDKTLILNINLPEGYSTAVLPQPVTLKLPDNSAVFMYDIANNGNSIRLTTKFSINRIVFMPDEYYSVKEFYNEVMKKQAEAIVIKKDRGE